MAGIATTIQIHDRMSSVLGNMNNALNLILSSFEAVQSVTSSSVDSASWEAARESITQAGASLVQYREELERLTTQSPADTPTGMNWSALNNQEVFTNTGAERFQSEINSVNSTLDQLNLRQVEISSQAQRLQVVPPGMMNDVTSVQNRMQSLQQRVQQLNSIPVNLRTDRVNNELESLRGRLSQATQIQEHLNSAMGRMDISAANADYQRLNVLLGSAERNIRDMVPAQQNLNREIQRGSGQASNLGGKLASLLSVYMLLRGAKKAIDLSDTYMQTQGRLSMIVGEQETVKDLQDQIYASAQRSRSSYSDTADVVSKLALRAGSAFGNNQEVIGFAENLNKLFVIAGASQEEQRSASLQLTQALGSGVLRGEELNAVFEAAPNIIQTIADYMDVPIGKVREMAKDGKLTANTVKNAMLSATTQINEQFEQMPMTWGQAFTSIQNTALMAFQPVLEQLNAFIGSEAGQAMIEGVTNALIFLADIASGAISVLAQGAQFIVDNWDYISPILIGVAVAIGAAMLAAGIAAFTSWIMVAWPFLLIASVVAILLITLQKAGVTFEQMGQVIGGVFGFVYAVIHNIIANIWNLIATFIEFFVNVWNDPLDSIGRLFFGLFDSILEQVETVANAIDSILNTNMSGAISGFRGKMSGLLDKRFGEQSVTIKRMAQLDTGDTVVAGSDLGAKFGSKLDNMGQNLNNLMGGIGAKDIWEGIGNNTGDTAGNTAKMADSMDILDEELKYLRDAAEQEIINRFTLADMKIDISNSNTLTTKTDFDDVNRMFGEVTAEALATMAEGAYA